MVMCGRVWMRAMTTLTAASLLVAGCGEATERSEQDPILFNNNTTGSGGGPGDGPSNNASATNNATNNTANNTTNNQTNNATNNGGEETSGLAVLGDGKHSTDAVAIDVVATDQDFLNTPRDLAFNPEIPGELWVLNLADNSTVVLENAGQDDQNALYFGGPGKDHFMARPSSLAFGAPGTFATTQETDAITQPSTPADFMGPSLWTADKSIYDGGHYGHLDMLHNSPNGAGIAWEQGNAYWVFDGYHNSLTRYDFVGDHGPGGSDHSDGVISRYVQGEVSYVEGVPSHLEIDHDSQLLYVADTGNNRIAALDITSGQQGGPISPNYDGVAQHHYSMGVLETVAAGDDVELTQPSGLALHDGVLYVTDNATSKIVAVDLEGTLLDWLDLSGEIPAGGLMGIEVGPSGALFVVDAVGDRILRISALD